MALKISTLMIHRFAESLIEKQICFPYNEECMELQHKANICHEGLWLPKAYNIKIVNHWWSLTLIKVLDFITSKLTDMYEIYNPFYMSKQICTKIHSHYISCFLYDNCYNVIFQLLLLTPCIYCYEIMMCNNSFKWARLNHYLIAVYRDIVATALVWKQCIFVYRHNI